MRHRVSERIITGLLLAAASNADVIRFDSQSGVGDWNSASTTPKWNLTGGEIDVADLDPAYDEEFVGRNVRISVSGGLFDVHQPFSTTNDFEFSGGTIRVGEGVSGGVTFSVDTT